MAVSTLGCKVNVFESELLAQQLAGGDCRRVGAAEEADLYLINTCTVTAEADRQARQLVRRAIRRNPDALVVVTGCYAQVDPEACAAIPGVDLVLGNHRKLNFPALLPELEKGRLPRILVGEMDRRISLPDQLLGGFEGRTRAFLQVQQGCDQGCTFCIIHRARGPSRSFEPELVERQFRRLLLNGYREIVLCGVDLGSYGGDREAGTTATLAGLLRRLTEIEGDYRIRLSSVDPVHLGDELIEVLASDDRLCPHLHLSLQSGSTLILKRMKRRATRESLYERVAAVRGALPAMVFSADIMVGFPTEGEAHFEQTLAAVEELEIAWPHVFAYSPRRGTPAAAIPDQVPVPERRRRAALVRQAGRTVWRRVAARRVGARARLLVEGGGAPPPGTVRARAADYFPVLLPLPEGEGEAIGEWAEAEITGIDGEMLIARRAAQPL